MYASDALERIVEELEFIEAEKRQLHANGPHFQILCRSGQDLYNPSEVIAVYLVYAGRTFQVALGASLLRLFGYMARHKRLAQTARQIENGTRAVAWSGRGRRTCFSAGGIPRRHIRIYVKRIRAALDSVLREAGLEIRSDAVLVSENTPTNETGYRLYSTLGWLHIDGTSSF